MNKTTTRPGGYYSKMSIEKDLKTFGGLLIVLFVIMVIVGAVWLGSGYLKKTICEQADDDYVWNNEICQYSATNTTEADVTAIDKVDIVEAVADTVLALLALVTIIAIFRLLVKIAKGMQGASD